MTDQSRMDSSTHNNPTSPQETEAKQSHAPVPAASSIESHFPTADANQLLELIAQGHDPANLNNLINHSYHHAA